MFISSTARSALRPRQGAAAARALDQRLAPGDAGYLRRFRQAVDVGAERDHWPARTPARNPAGRQARDVALDREAILLQHIGEILRGLDFLIGELAVGEH